MANAVFVAPFLLPATVRFIAAAALLPDVRLGLISQDPEDRLRDDLRAALSGHYRVTDGTDAQQIADATRVMARHLDSGMDETVPGAGNAVCFEDRLHPGLVAEVARNLSSHPLDAKGVADLAERHLKLLEHAEEGIDAAEMPGHDPGSVGNLLRIGAVGHPVVP